MELPSVTIPYRVVKVSFLRRDPKDWSHEVLPLGSLSMAPDGVKWIQQKVQDHVVDMFGKVEWFDDTDKPEAVTNNSESWHQEAVAAWQDTLRPRSSDT
jgi:hypothetical protein